MAIPGQDGIFLRRQNSFRLMGRMSKENRIRICRACFFVSLLFLLPTGCATAPSHRVLGRHLENYRKVYLVKGKEDPREVIPRVLSRLQLAGFEVTEVPFDRIKQLNHEAVENGLDQLVLVCSVSYVSASDPAFYNSHSFQTLHISFHDLQKGDLVFEVNHFDYYAGFPENTDLNRLFVQISDRFFPGQTNPFIGKK